MVIHSVTPGGKTLLEGLLAMGRGNTRGVYPATEGPVTGFAWAGAV
jgi:hypothetical protein